MGLVEVKLTKATVDYPGCVLKDNQICTLGGDLKWPHTELIGAGSFLSEPERQQYGFPPNDTQSTPVGGKEMAYGLGVQMVWDEGQVEDLFTRAVRSWRERLMEGVSA